MKHYMTYGLVTYSPKNRKWADVIEYIKPFENIILFDELALDAFKHSIEHKVKELNELYPKTKPISCRFSHQQVRVSHQSNGVPEEAFILSISRVRGVFRFSENNLMVPEHNIIE